jgi:hypothetical protein
VIDTDCLAGVADIGFAAAGGIVLVEDIAVG